MKLIKLDPLRNKEARLEVVTIEMPHYDAEEFKRKSQEAKEFLEKYSKEKKQHEQSTKLPSNW